MSRPTIEFVTGDKPAPWASESRDRPNHWRVTVHYQRRRLTVDFWTGSMAGEPDVKGVLDCLISDADLGEQSFHEFCADLGYDEDSRKAHAVWEACRHEGPRVRRLLGDDFDAIGEWVRS